MEKLNKLKVASKREDDKDAFDKMEKFGELKEANERE